MQNSILKKVEIQTAVETYTLNVIGHYIHDMETYLLGTEEGSGAIRRASCLEISKVLEQRDPLTESADISANMLNLLESSMGLIGGAGAETDEDKDEWESVDLDLNTEEVEETKEEEADYKKILKMKRAKKAVEVDLNNIDWDKAHNRLMVPKAWDSTCETLATARAQYVRGDRSEYLYKIIMQLDMQAIEEDYNAIWDDIEARLLNKKVKTQGETLRGGQLTPPTPISTLYDRVGSGERSKELLYKIMNIL